MTANDVSGGGADKKRKLICIQRVVVFLSIILYHVVAG
jgi:hypothetical protein